MYKDKALQRKTTLARVRRYRISQALHKGVTSAPGVTQPKQIKTINQEAHTGTQSKPAVSLPGVIEVKNKQEEVRATKRLSSQPFQSFFKSNQLKQRSTA